MSRSVCLTAYFVGICTFLSFAGSAYAAPPQYNRAFFRDRLAAIAKQHHIGFVVEGEPHPAALAHITDFPDVPGETRDQAIQWLADAYDYTLLARRGSLYLLRKKYTYPQEMPNVTPEECRLAALDIGELLARISTLKVGTGINVDEERDSLAGLVASLSPEQWERSRSGGLNVRTDFTPQQRQTTWGMMLYQYTGGMAAHSKRPVYVLDPDCNVRFSRDRQGQPGYIFHPKGAKQIFGRLDRPTVLRGTSKGTTTTTEAAKLPTADDPIAHPLSDIVKRLNARRNGSPTARTKKKASEPGETVLSVEEALAAKPITLIAADDDTVASPEQTARAAAEVYGLRLRRDSDQAATIARLPPPAQVGVMDGLAMVRSSLPVPLVTALHLAEDAALATQIRQQDNSREGYRNRLQLIKQRFNLKDNQQALQNEAVWQLLQSLEVRLDRKPQEDGMFATPIPLRKSPMVDQSCFALFTMQEFLRELCRQSIVPLYVTRFEDMVMTCGSFTNPQGVKMRSIMFFLPDPATGKPTTPLIAYNNKE